MKTVTSQLAVHLAGENTTLCRLLLISRTDGVTVAFTDTDQDLIYGDGSQSQPSSWYAQSTDASPWWNVVGDTLVSDTAASLVSAGWTYTAATYPWLASMTFSGDQFNGDCSFLGSPQPLIDLTFTTNCSVHYDLIGAEGMVKIGLADGLLWGTINNYIGFQPDGDPGWVTAGEFGGPCKMNFDGWGTWKLVMGNGTPEGRIVIDSEVQIVDGQRYALEFQVNSDRSLVMWFIDGKLVGQTTTNIPVAPLSIAMVFSSISITGVGKLFFRVESIDASETMWNYLSDDGLTFSALESKDDASPTNSTVTGFLNNDESTLGISEADVRAHVYDSATFKLRTVNWADLTMGDMKLLSGTVGDITMENGQYTMQLRGLTQYLTTKIGSVYGPTCRATLFGGGATLVGGQPIDPTNHWKCGLNQAEWVQNGTVGSSPDSLTIVPAGTLLQIGPPYPGTAPAPADWFADGLITFKTGALAPQAFEIAAWDGTTLTLFAGGPMPFAPAPGDQYAIEPGCSKMKIDCLNKFVNIINFAGEAEIPGLNVLVATSSTQVPTP